MNHMNRRNSNARRMKGIEVRYNKTRGLLRSLRVKESTKDLQKEIAYSIDTIERHGFRFFPNHYIYDEVVRLSKMVEELADHPSTSKNTTRQSAA